MQEKPSFNNSNTLLIAFFALYTKYFEIENNANFGQLVLIPVDPIFQEFERMLAKICKRNRINDIYRYYKVIDQNDSYDDAVLHLKKREGNRATYPDYIYARESFFNKKINPFNKQLEQSPSIVTVLAKDVRADRPSL
jgi:hypothetical protein